MARKNSYEVKSSFRLNMLNPQHVKINHVIQNLNPDIYKSKNQFLIEACQFYIDHYGEEDLMEKADKNRDPYLSREDLAEIREELIEAAVMEARKEVMKLLGGMISGMNGTPQPVKAPAVKEEVPETETDVMEDADVAGFAMGWMAKGD